MRFLISLLAAVFIALAALPAGAPATAQTRPGRKKARTVRRTTSKVNQAPAAPKIDLAALPVGEDGVRRITPEAARAAIESGGAIIVDVRGESSFNAGHVKGALLLPIDVIGSRSGELPRGKLIITYCS